MKFIIICLLCLFACLSAQEVVLSGNQHSIIQYRLDQNIEPFEGIDILMVSFVVPSNFFSTTYQQKISKLNFNFSPEPREREEERDIHGNLIKKFYWDRPKNTIQCKVSLQAENSVNLMPLTEEISFPLKDVPSKFSKYLHSTNQIQSENKDILQLATELTKYSKTEYEAIQKILHYIVEHMRYTLTPKQYDALYGLRTGKGNCQNYSHLSAAMLRAVGIPTRIVNGITFKKGYDVTIGSSEYSFDMAQGRHSWIEVYFPGVGWLPFDAQQTEFFVSNRYLRIEVGLDNEETIQDGLVKWTQTQGSHKQMPKLEEIIESNFLTDEISLATEKRIPGLSKILLTPDITATSAILASKEPEEADITSPDLPTQPIEEILDTIQKVEIDYRKFSYQEPFEYGNMEFPQRFDFISARFIDEESIVQKGEIKRNFIVETAEYVTGNNYYSQSFILEKPIRLHKIGIALHNFGGSGFLWIEISEDSDGYPAEPEVLSQKIPTNHIRIPNGYDWVNFDFTQNGLILSPGRYWFTLKYSGSPIVNWFYSYGKTIGPVDGTRSRKASSSKWDKVLSFEFNYRITGFSAKGY